MNIKRTFFLQNCALIVGVVCERDRQGIRSTDTSHEDERSDALSVQQIAFIS